MAITSTCNNAESKKHEIELQIKNLTVQLKDKDWVVRASAAESLGKLGAKEAIPELMELLNKDEDYLVRISASLSLDLLGVNKSISKPAVPIFAEDPKHYLEKSLQYGNELLISSPKDTATYYNLGVLYDEHFDDPAHAIWCYTKYLEFTPDAPDREKVERWIRGCRKRLKEAPKIK